MKRQVLRFTTLILLGLWLWLPNGLAASDQIQWHSFSDGMNRAKFENKKVFLHFYAVWCVFCAEMAQKAFKDPAVIGSLNENFIPIRVDVDQDMETASMFRIQGLPETLFIAENGDIISRRPGYISPDQLKDMLGVIIAQGAEPAQNP